jgi:peroxiredoxin family protein
MTAELEELRERVVRLEQGRAARLSVIVSTCSRQSLDNVSSIVGTAGALGLDAQMFFTSFGVCLFGTSKPKGLRERVRRWLYEDKDAVGFVARLKEWQSLGVKLYACGESCRIHGIVGKDLSAFGALEVGGLTTFMANALDGQMTLVL